MLIFKLDREISFCHILYSFRRFDISLHFESIIRDLLYDNGYRREMMMEHKMGIMIFFRNRTTKYM